MLKKLIKNLFKRRIYLDYASLTPIDSEVMFEINKYSKEQYANPSSLYEEGVKAKEAIKTARAKTAKCIEAEEGEIIFTSGGTESNNLAIIGAIESLHEKGVAYEDMHMLISVIEHSSIRECANYLEGKGVGVEVIPVDKGGFVSVEKIEKMIRSNTVIISVMMVNNEIGSIQPIKDIAKSIRHFRSSHVANSKFDFQEFSYPLFHTDASQAVLYEDINVKKLGIDLLTIDSSKINGPRGFGTLFIKRHSPISPIIYGGGQEDGIRSGTENLPAIMGFAKAMEIATRDREIERKRISQLRNYFIDGLKKIRTDIKINAVEDFEPNPRQDLNHDLETKYSPHILNVLIPNIDNEFFVLQLDTKGIACSTKSSCLGDEEQSYVLNAIGAKSKESIRFSFGKYVDKKALYTTLEVIDHLIYK